MTKDRLNVLVIDDDTEVCEVVRMALEADGMRVMCVQDGGDGLEVLGHVGVDVVILDLVMPGLDGWMTLAEMRKTPSLAHIPVIVLSGKTQDEAKILAFKQGVQQYVTKPFNVMELSARVSALAKGLNPRVAEGSGAGETEFRKLAVRKGGRTVLLALEDIVYLSARNKSTYAHTFENQYLVDLTLGELETRLGRESFSRVHRSYLVNLNRVREILRVDGSYEVVAADRDETHIPVARRQVRSFREAVGI